jgi:hypothetical protein
MKKLSLLILVLSLVLVPIVGASKTQQAWPSGTGNSGVQVVNLDTAAGTVQAVYVDETGTKYTLPPQTLASGESYTYFAQPDDTATPSNDGSFRGAVQLSSDVQIAAIAKAEWNSGAVGAASYSGASAGANMVVGPLLVIDHYGTTSALTVQNTDMNNAITVDLTFTPAGGASFAQTMDIAAGASTTLDLAIGGNFVDPDTSSDAGWVGSVVVESTAAPVVLAVHTTSVNDGFVYAYDGFTTTDQDTAYAPLVRRNFSGLTTAIQVVETSGAAGTVSVTYSGFVDADGDFVQDAGEEYECTDQAAVAANGSALFAQVLLYNDPQANCGGDTTMPEAFLGSAKVETSAGAIAVVVNDQIDPGVGGKATASAYSGFFASQGGSKVSSPLARHDFACFSTGIQIQNIGGGAVDVVGAYTTSGDSINTNTPADATARTLQPGESTTYFIGFNVAGFAPDWLGSFEATATGTGDVAIVAITNDQAVNFGGQCTNWGLSYDADTAIFNDIGQ